ncbi:hypothetical protein BDV28DRAFT_15901 [Aspergillus coremiiformis]|uniref:Uncharacterized protein n=1 Tax=Aspergillus coremiiformis TaxID=138285 RepID=A0A5N6Z1X9_9EURO|nr:hypothetical protein BDV28DRAFT_15901 [Aspergillus coremiiformis]
MSSTTGRLTQSFLQVNCRESPSLRVNSLPTALQATLASVSKASCFSSEHADFTGGSDAPCSRWASFLPNSDGCASAHWAWKAPAALFRLSRFDGCSSVKARELVKHRNGSCHTSRGPNAVLSGYYATPFVAGQAPSRTGTRGLGVIVPYGSGSCGLVRWRGQIISL